MMIGGDTTHIRDDHIPLEYHILHLYSQLYTTVMSSSSHIHIYIYIIFGDYLIPHIMMIDLRINLMINPPQIYPIYLEIIIFHHGPGVLGSFFG